MFQVKQLGGNYSRQEALTPKRVINGAPYSPRTICHAAITVRPPGDQSRPEGRETRLLTTK